MFPAPKPLSGIRVLDFSTLTAPWASMLLSAYGADVIAIEPPNPGLEDTLRTAGLGLGKRSVVLDLKREGATQLVLRMIRKSDVIIESMRPGKMESLGLSPGVVTEHAPQTIYARFSNFGQDSVLRDKGGHDINAIALGGALALVGTDQPLPPASLLGDWASGGLMTVIGILLAIMHRQQTGRGQVIDAAMADGAAMLAGPTLEMWKSGLWNARGNNLLDGSRPYYTTYKCADGLWIAVGAIEPKFFHELILTLELDDRVNVEDQYKWSEDEVSDVKRIISERFGERARSEWLCRFENSDACVTPVLELSEVADYPINQSRGNFIQSASGPRSAIAPRLSDCTLEAKDHIPERGEHTIEVLQELGFAEQEIAAALDKGVAITSSGDTASIVKNII